MTIIRGFVVDGQYCLETSDPTATEVAFELAADVRVSVSGMNEHLLYRGYTPYGVSLHTAVALGWARVLPGESPVREEDGARGDEARTEAPEREELQEHR